jgi:hypothetical protein
LHLETADVLLPNENAKGKLVKMNEPDVEGKKKKKNVYTVEEDVAGVYNERIKVTQSDTYAYPREGGSTKVYRGN